ncbi:HD domain-containing protein [Brevibacillus migulae]|uniref:HD domain-containing protein n=1 Tax=Brevibacillus migulae TaxID=1644114 RepID=UPI00106E6F3C|nr:HD domain-containing protein [Brevibacillus migulae]
MIVTDKLYGTFEVEEVLAELINSAPVQRLKKIHQGGASYLVNPAWNVTRYEHSLGVMLLIRKLGGSLEEQIAGLLHDVSHTAFSHVIDHVLQHAEEDYHEHIFADVLESSEIPQILARHGLSLESLLAGEWRLLDRPLPELCADRIDYTLRDMATYGVITNEEAVRFLASLTVAEGKIAITSIAAAEWFVDTFYREVIDFFLHPLNVYGYDRLIRLLSLALEKRLLTIEDFLGDDEKVLQKLRDAQDQELALLLEQLRPGVRVAEDEENYDCSLRLKERLIDPPLLLSDGTMCNASEYSPAIQEQNRRAREKSKKGTYVRILSYQ